MIIDKDTYLEAPLRLRNGQVFSSNGYWLMPAPGYTGALIELIDNQDVVIENTRMKDASVGITVDGKTNYATFNNVKMIDCDTGIVSTSAWDSSYVNVTIRRCINGILLQGSTLRPSNPHTFFNLHVESFRQSAVVITNSYNLEFHGGKFHGNIENPPDNYSFICTNKNWPPCIFHGGKFFFNPMGHFDKSDKPKAKLIAPILDKYSVGNISVIEPVFNERGKK